MEKREKWSMRADCRQSRAFERIQGAFLTGLAVLLAMGIPLCAESVISVDLVSETAQAGAFPLVVSGRAAALHFDSGDDKGVIRAVGDLQADVDRVTGIKPALSADRPVSGRPVIIGTLGKSGMIDSLVASGKLDISISKESRMFVIAGCSTIPGIDKRW